MAKADEVLRGVKLFNEIAQSLHFLSFLPPHLIRGSFRQASQARGRKKITHSYFVKRVGIKQLHLVMPAYSTDFPFEINK